MTISEQIKAEIERRVDILATVSVKQAKNGDSEMSTYYHGKAVSLEELIPFLSSLESEKPVPKDLEQRRAELQVNFREINEAFEAGKAEQKEQMMKEAVEYEVGMHGEPIKITFDKYVQRARGIWPGDKVRIIIVKED